jgi:hypothetical protein
VRRLALLVWVVGAGIYAANGPGSDSTLQQNTVAPTLHGSISTPSKTLAGATLADIVQRLPHDRAGALGITGEPTIDDSIETMRVARPAAAHSEPVVSSPTTYRFPPGRELQVLQRQEGWIQVLDPVTKFKGWVLQLYLSSPGITVADDRASAPQRESAPPRIVTSSEREDLANETPQRKSLKSKRVKWKERRDRAPVDADVEPPRYASGRYALTRKQYARGHYPEVIPERRFLLRPFALRRYQSVY